jgi:hypothetical protein
MRGFGRNQGRGFGRGQNFGNGFGRGNGLRRRDRSCMTEEIVDVRG